MAESEDHSDACWTSGCAIPAGEAVATKSGSSNTLRRVVYGFEPSAGGSQVPGKQRGRKVLAVSSCASGPTLDIERGTGIDESGGIGKVSET